MIHRRELLLAAAGALAAQATASAIACANDAPTPKTGDKPPKTKADKGPTEDTPMEETAADPHAAHKAPEGGDTPAANAAPAAALAAASGACIQAGNACLAHCLKLLADGDTSMGDCAQRVNDMLAVCEATGRLAANASAHAVALAKVCEAVCSDCAKACAPHVGHHAECKACKESCDAMVAAVKAFVG